MRIRMLTAVAAVAALALPVAAAAQSYRFSVVATGLERPLGIAVEGSDDLYFTEVPTPGVGGGRNGVSHLDG